MTYKFKVHRIILWLSNIAIIAINLISILHYTLLIQLPVCFVLTKYTSIQIILGHSHQKKKKKKALSSHLKIRLQNNTNNKSHYFK